MVLVKEGANATTTNGAAGKRTSSKTSPRSAVEDVLAALSMESSGGSAGDPSKHMRQVGFDVSACSYVLFVRIDYSLSQRRHLHI